MFAHRNHLIPFYFITPYLEKLVRKFLTISFNPHITTSPINPTENIHSPERSPYDSFENSGEETTPDPKLLDNVRTPFDAYLSSPLSFDNSQQIGKDPNIQIKKLQVATIIPPTSPVDTTSSQNLPSCQINNPILNELLPPTSQLDATSA